MAVANLSQVEESTKAFFLTAFKKKGVNTELYSPVSNTVVNQDVAIGPVETNKHHWGEPRLSGWVVAARLAIAQ